MSNYFLFNFGFSFKSLSQEAILCIKELNAPQLHYVFVEEVISQATEKKSADRIASGKLFAQMMKENVLKYSEFEQGYNLFLIFSNYNFFPR